MIKKSVDISTGFQITVASSSDQLFITISVTGGYDSYENLIEDIYTRTAKILVEYSSQIVTERCFGNLNVYPQFFKIRQNILSKYKIRTAPPSYIEGRSCINGKLTGIQIWAVKKSSGILVKEMLENNSPVGYTWESYGSKYFVLNNLSGKTGYDCQNEKDDRSLKCKDMFYKAEKLLEQEGATYQNVVRTWIYIDDILKWYDEFNAVRNACYSNFKLLDEKDLKKIDNMYLPASTGIAGKNPSNIPSVMNVFAIHQSSNSIVKVRSIYGIRQRSPFLYGSAFSRAVVVETPKNKLIFISGTASIDEQGKSIFINDPESQIRYSFDVVSKLIENEGATLKDICESTVFLKNKSDYSTFQKVINELGIPNIPSVSMVADICREELLFEIDGLVVLEK